MPDAPIPEPTVRATALGVPVEGTPDHTPDQTRKDQP